MMPVERIRRERGLIRQLFRSFLRISPSTFGGGYAMMPVIEREIVEKRKWMDENEAADMVSLSGSAPGGVGVNAAAYVGFRKAGIPGAVAAVAGVTLPSFLIVIAISVFYLFFQDHPKVEAALKGVQAAVIALMLLAAYRMAKISVFDAATGMISIGTLLILVLTGVNPFYAIISGMLAGIAIVVGKVWIGLEVRTEKPGIHQANRELLYPEYYI